MNNMILFGDSDISRWPSSLHPSAPSQPSKVNNYGKSGAELADISIQIDQWKAELGDGRDNNAANDENVNTASAGYLFVCCAGENDIGCGKSLDRILETFRAVLDELFPPIDDSTKQQPSYPNNNNKSKMIFLGPKFEPWLTLDNASRKQYIKLNSGLQRAIRNHHACNQIVYIDCLTLFCTKETSNVPGAVYGGRAMPDTNYFAADGLHLNEVGYHVWKELVEEKVSGMYGSK